jgi:hypothetical protein
MTKKKIYIINKKKSYLDVAKILFHKMIPKNLILQVQIVFQ